MTLEVSVTKIVM